MIEIIVAFLLFLLTLNGLYFHTSIIAHIFSLYLVINYELENLIFPTIFALIINLVFLFLIKRKLSRHKLMISDNLYFFEKKKYDFKLFYFIIFITVASINWYNLPWFNLSDFVEARMEFNSSSSQLQRFIKFVFPAIIIAFIYKKKYILFYLTSIAYVLAEGSKSSIIGVFGVLFFTNRYLIKNLISEKIVKNVSKVSIAAFIFISPLFYVDFSFKDFLISRFKGSEINPYLKLNQYLNQSTNNSYLDFIFNPFKIFYNSLLGSKEQMHTSAGNWLTNPDGYSQFEYLLRLYMEGLLIYGIPGIIFIYLITYFIFLFSLRLFGSFKSNNLIFFIPLVYIEIINVTIRGKLSNSITNFFITALFIIILLYVQRKFTFKNI